MAVSWVDLILDWVTIICSLEEIVFGSSNSGSFRGAAKFKCDGRTDERTDGQI